MKVSEVEVDRAFANVKELEFPQGFEFGAVTAAGHVEGGHVDTNWARWEQQGTREDGRETVKEGQKAGIMTDSWEQFLTVDLPLIQETGLSSYRFSIEWSRLMPTAGSFDEAALARYVEWCIALRKVNVEPCITLLHFTYPGWFEDLGGWTVRENVAHFVRFVEFAVPALVPHCSRWCTINEPVGTCVNGYMVGIHPPGKRGAVVSLVRAIANQHVGHRHASNAISALDPDAVIMVATNVALYDPASPCNPITNLIAAILSTLWNEVWMDAIVFGRFPLPLDVLAWVCGYGRELRALKGTVNHLGINAYARVTMQCHLWRWLTCRQFGYTDDELPEGVTGGYITRAHNAAEQRAFVGPIFNAPHSQGHEMNDMEWDLVPSIFERLLARYYRRYKMPIYVTESGCADAAIPDVRGVRYLAGCLQVMHNILAKGVDLRGYYYFALLDNFEWAEGYGPQFGLYKVDRESADLKRTPTLRQALLSKFIAAHKRSADARAALAARVASKAAANKISHAMPRLSQREQHLHWNHFAMRAVSLVLAMAWYSLVTHIPRGYTGDHPILIAFGNAVLVTFICATPFRMLVTFWMAGTTLVASLTASAALISSWMWKEFVALALARVQGWTYVGRRSAVDDCFVGTLAATAAVTCVVVAAALLLPSPAQPPVDRSWQSYGAHACIVFTGSTALPLGFAWYKMLIQLLRIPFPWSAIALASNTQAILCLVLVRVLVAGPLALCLAALALRAAHRFAEWRRVEDAQQCDSPSARSARTATLLNRSLEFLLAWLLWDGFVALWRGLPSSPCEGNGIVGKALVAAPIFDASRSWQPPLLLMLLLVGCAVAARKAACRRETCCDLRTPAVAWDLLIGTIGIQLGWATVATLFNAIKAAPLNKARPFAFSGLLFMTLMLVTIAWVLANQEIVSQRRKPRAPAHPGHHRTLSEEIPLMSNPAATPHHSRQTCALPSFEDTSKSV